jgi:hypothetical protein
MLSFSIIVPSHWPSPHYYNSGGLRLVLVVAKLYLNLTHAASTFSLLLTHQRSSSRLQHLAHSHIILLSLSQHHHFRLNHFKIHFVDNKFKKTN